MRIVLAIVVILIVLGTHGVLTASELEIEIKSPPEWVYKNVK